MGIENRLGMDTRCNVIVSTCWLAALMGDPSWAPALAISRPLAATAGHNNAPRRKAGVTGFPLAMRASVFAIALRIRLLDDGSFIAPIASGKRGSSSPCFARCSIVGAANPAIKSLSVSSNRRAAGISANRCKHWLMAAWLVSSIVKPSFAANLTTRSIRTGSSLYRVAGSPMTRTSRCRMSSIPSRSSRISLLTGSR